MNTMTHIRIGEEEYLFIKEYQEDEKYRKSLNLLTMQTFCFDFEAWYEQGFWTDRYRPYSLVHKEQVVANISVNPIEFGNGEKRYHTLQIGTVMTDPKYRERGLSRVLFDIIMKEYEEKADLMYLYANASVREFYPKFGFVEAQEHIYKRQFTKNNKYSFRKLNGASQEDRQLICRLIRNARAVSRYSMINNPYLPMFYLMAPMAECIYYCETLDLAAVVEYEADYILVDDIFCEGEFDLEEVISSMLDRSESWVSLGFTPHNTDSYQVELLQEVDTTFFVKGNNFIENGRLPILSHA